MEYTLTVGDPRFDSVWKRYVAAWREKGTKITRHARADQIRSYLTAAFVVEHWHGGVRNGPGRTKGWTCDRFDPVARLCLAHDERPPICSDYPYYGRAIGSLVEFDSPRCSFWADAPKDKRPAEWVPVKVRHL